VGSNYYLKDHDAKISVDYTFVDQQTVSGDQSIVTLQIALGF